jgi:hypothetical protein
MRQSQLFTKTRKEAPKDEVAKNAQLLIRAGYIHKEMAGVYSLLPLGLKVINNIGNIIREEMNKIGGQELHLTVLQDKAPWEKSGRWSDQVVDNWFKTQLKNGTEVGLGFTHEESLTALISEYVNSFRDLPFSAYQIQTKFRNEARAKSGIMRGREFLMKDLYSFSKNEAEHLAFYEKAKEAYKEIFRRAGLSENTYLTYASGGTFSKYSHEFQTITEAGEDVIYISKEDYGGQFLLPHEVGHAMFTERGKTARSHQRDLDRVGATPDYEDNIINTSLEYKLDRRAGVDPHKFNEARSGGRGSFMESFRGTIGDDEGLPVQWNAGKPDSEDLRMHHERDQTARAVVGRFDAGRRFDEKGRVRSPNTLDARISMRGRKDQGFVGAPRPAPQTAEKTEMAPTFVAPRKADQPTPPVGPKQPRQPRAPKPPGDDDVR